MAIVTTDDKNYKDIAEAIRGKTGKTDLLLPSQMANEINGITGGGDDEYAALRWKRPSTWIPLPNRDDTKDEIFMVMSVPDEGSFYAFTTNTPFTVSWGDTENTTQSFQANEIAKFEFTVDNVSDIYFDEITEERQSLIKVQADKGKLTQISFAQDDTEHPNYNKNLIEVVLHLQSFTLLDKINSNTKLISLEIYGEIQVKYNNLRYVLNGLNNIENLVLQKTSNITEFPDFPDWNLKFIELDVASRTRFLSFANCKQLACIILKNLKGGYIVENCPNLIIYTPVTLSENGTVLGDNFVGYYRGSCGINKLIFENTENGYISRFIETFRGNTNIRYVMYAKLINTTGGRVFDGCNNLEICKLTGSVNDGSRFFYGCTKLKEFGLLDFSECTNLNDTFTDCKSLKKVNIVPNSIKVSVSFKNCTSFTVEELNRIFTECLADLTGQNPQTITITGAGGASECDVTIAQSKNWTVVR